MDLLKEENFRRVIDGNEVRLFTLRNKNGCIAQFTNYDARWLSAWMPGRQKQYSVLKCISICGVIGAPLYWIIGFVLKQRGVWLVMSL